MRPRRKTSDSDTGRAPPRTLPLAPGGARTSTGKWPHGNLTSSTRMAQESGSGRQLAQVQTWTLLASQIIPPRKYSPCPRARMQDPTGPGPGTRTGPGRTPGRTAAATHHPRHRTGSILGDFTRKLQTNVLTWRPGLGPGRPILTLGQPASGLETGQHRSTSRRHQAWNGPASQLLPVITVGRTRHPVSASCHTAR